MKRINGGQNLKARDVHAITKDQMHKEETRRRVAWLTGILKNEVDKALGAVKERKSGTNTAYDHHWCQNPWMKTSLTSWATSESKPIGLIELSGFFLKS